MSVIRTVHNKENPYAQLSKSVINDSNLSFKALGLWTWVMSKKDNWVFYVEQIAKERKEGKDAIYSAIKELQSNGYCIRVQMRKEESGKFNEFEYLFFEYKPTPDDIAEIKKLYPLAYFPDLKEELKEKVPHRGFPGPGFPGPENPPLVNIDNTSKERATSESRNAAAFFSCLEDKPITDLDRQIICSSYTEDQVKQGVAWLDTKKNIDNYAAYLTSGLQKLAQGAQLQANLTGQHRAEDNKSWTEQTASKAKCPVGIRIEVLNQHVEFGNGVHQPSCVGYEEPGYKEKFKEAAKKWKCEI